MSEELDIVFNDVIAFLEDDIKEMIADKIVDEYWSDYRLLRERGINLRSRAFTDGIVDKVFDIVVDNLRKIVHNFLGDGIVDDEKLLALIEKRLPDQIEWAVKWGGVVVWWVADLLIEAGYDE